MPANYLWFDNYCEKSIWPGHSVLQDNIWNVPVRHQGAACNMTRMHLNSDRRNSAEKWKSVINSIIFYMIINKDWWTTVCFYLVSGYRHCWSLCSLSQYLVMKQTGEKHQQHHLVDWNSNLFYYSRTKEFRFFSFSFTLATYVMLIGVLLC